MAYKGRTGEIKRQNSKVKQQMLKILKTAKKKKKAMSGLMWALESKNNKIDSAEN